MSTITFVKIKEFIKHLFNKSKSRTNSSDKVDEIEISANGFIQVPDYMIKQYKARGSSSK